MLDLPASLDKAAASRLLEDPETDAFSALVAAAAFVEDDLLDDDGHPVDESELRLMLSADHVNPRSENLTRVIGLLNAVAGDEFLVSPGHFRRMAGAIIEGDPFQYEEDGEEPTLPDIYWALYLAGLVSEDTDIVSELGPKVQKYISKLAEEEAEDTEALAATLEREGGDPEDLEPYMNKVLIIRRMSLAQNLKDLGCDPEWMQGTEPELAAEMRA